MLEAHTDSAAREATLNASVRRSGAPGVPGAQEEVLLVFFFQKVFSGVFFSRSFYSPEVFLQGVFLSSRGSPEGLFSQRFSLVGVGEEWEWEWEWEWE